MSVLKTKEQTDSPCPVNTNHKTHTCEENTNVDKNTMTVKEEIYDNFESEREQRSSESISTMAENILKQDNTLNIKISGCRDNKEMSLSQCFSSQLSYTSDSMTDVTVIKTEEQNDCLYANTKNHKTNVCKENTNGDIQKITIKEEIVEYFEAERDQRNYELSGIMTKNIFKFEKLNNTQNIKISCIKSEAVSSSRELSYYIPCAQKNSKREKTTKAIKTESNHIDNNIIKLSVEGTICSPSDDSSSEMDIEKLFKIPKKHTYGFEDCLKTFSNNSTSDQHENPYSNTKYGCDHCDHKTKTKSHLINHLKTHTGEKPYACKYCDYKSQFKSDLTRHNRQHTGEKPYSCKDCDYRSKYQSDLTRHIRRHTGEKPYGCKYCDYKSSTKSDLTVHIRRHLGGKPYECKYCDFKSSNKRSLTVHIRQHTGENKPFVCKFCDYRSQYKSDLTRHIRRHTGEKPYECNYCDYKCSDQSGFIVHMRRHRGEKPFACRYCDYKSSDKSNLTVHIRQHMRESICVKQL